jgi:tyrosine-protein phosphatase SIW14
MPAIIIERPLNFGLVCPGVYRAGCPGRHNLAFLQRLGLRTLVRLIDCDYPAAVAEWIVANDVRVISCGMTPNQEPFVGLDSATLLTALSAIQQPALRPLMVHCLHGQQATGVLVGCLRRQQRWSLTAIFDEYRRYAGPAASALDVQMIELLDTSARAHAPLALPVPSEALGSLLMPPPPIPAAKVPAGLDLAPKVSRIPSSETAKQSKRSLRTDGGVATSAAARDSAADDGIGAAKMLAQACGCSAPALPINPSSRGPTRLF